jgi:hypothetical protein
MHTDDRTINNYVKIIQIIFTSFVIKHTLLWKPHPHETHSVSYWLNIFQKNRRMSYVCVCARAYACACASVLRRYLGRIYVAWVFTVHTGLFSGTLWVFSTAKIIQRWMMPSQWTNLKDSYCVLRGTILPFYRMDWKNPRKTSLSITGVRPEISTQNISNIKRCFSADLLFQRQLVR